MIRAQGAWGSFFSDTADMRHLSPDSQARLHRAGSVPCKPKTLKMSAYGTFSPTARPPRVLPTPWALPTPAFATWQGCGEKPPAPLPQEALGRLQPVKAKPLRGCFASLDGFPAPSASVSFCYPHGDGEGSRATKSCILPLTPWNRQHSP